MENEEQVHLVISDVDGTLLNPDGDLSPVNYVAAGRLQQAGVKFSLASARPHFGMQWLTKILDVRSTCAGLNGAVIFEPGGEILSELELDRKLAEELAGFIRWHAIDVWIYTRNSWFVPRLNGSRVRQNSEALRTEPTRYDDVREINGPILKVVGASDDSERLGKCAEVLVRDFSGLVSVTPSRPHFLDITHVEADKGRAAGEIARREGVPLKAALAIGDSNADVPMFAAVGRGVAMGQSSPDVQQAAARVTRSNTDNGFAWAVEYALGRKEFTTVPAGTKATA